ncbi:MAG: patatin-like phospholipase family protein [Bryobacterales bacterium]|nr:patatin-like phospholipase family protein [Bryobacterales bacterium]
MRKTALVLSGGALFGAYQAGAWRFLETVFQPDLVVGTSVGALNGWCIAGGVPADAIASHWMEPRTAQLLLRRTRALPLTGVFDRSELERRTMELTASVRPRIPFALTAVQLAGLESRIFEDREVTWRHMVASCAVPGGFAPVRIDGRLYIDGGFVNSLPIWAAVRLGATRVIAINALALAPSRVLKGVARGIGWISRNRKPANTGAEVLRIQPEQPLGTLADATRWNPETIRGWIERGESDARRAWLAAQASAAA